MNKQHLTVLISVISAILAAVPCLSAQRLTASWAFSMAPTTVMPMIAPATRLDMVDYYNSASDKTSPNELDGKCRITSMSPDDITVRTSDVSEWRLQLLPFKGDTIMMVLSSVDTPARDTDVRFYDRTWRPLDKTLFEPPHLRDFVATRKPSADIIADIADVIPFVLCDISYDAPSRTLTVAQNFEAYIPADEYATVSRHMLPQITYRYNGRRFVRQ